MNDNQAKNVKQVLQAARWMIDNVGWCQYRFTAYDTQGKIAGFCLSGAFDRVQADSSTIELARRFVRKSLPKGFETLPGFNDNKKTTKKKVLNLLDRLIKKA